MSESAGGGEELVFEDVDLVYVYAFDLGASISYDTLRWFMKCCGLIEGFWLPAKAPPENHGPTPVGVYLAARELGLIGSEVALKGFMNNEELLSKLANGDRIKELINRRHALFNAIIANDEKALDPDHLDFGHYARFKLVELEAEVHYPKFKKDLKQKIVKFRIEPYLLIHLRSSLLWSPSVAVITAWINLKGRFTVDELVNLEHLDTEVLDIKDALGNRYETVTLGEFFDAYIKALMGRGAKLGEIRKESAETIRVLPAQHIIVSIRGFRCSGEDECLTAEDVVKNHVKEIAGILLRRMNWRVRRTNGAEKDLGRNLSPSASYAMYLTRGASIFLGSLKLNKEIDDELRLGLALDRDTAFRVRELVLVTPVEFLVLWNKMIESSISFYRERLQDIEAEMRKGKAADLRVYMLLKNVLKETLDYYSRVTFFKTNPYKGIMEYGKEHYEALSQMNELASEAVNLGKYIKTYREEAEFKTQITLTVVYSILSVLISVFGLLEKFGLSKALIVTVAVATALGLFSRWYIRRGYEAG